MQFHPPVERLSTEVKLCALTPNQVVPLTSPNEGYCEDCGWRRALHKATSSASSSTQDLTRQLDSLAEGINELLADRRTISVALSGFPQKVFNEVKRKVKLVGPNRVEAGVTEDTKLRNMCFCWDDHNNDEDTGVRHLCSALENVLVDVLRSNGLHVVDIHTRNDALTESIVAGVTVKGKTDLAIYKGQFTYSMQSSINDVISTSTVVIEVKVDLVHNFPAAERQAIGELLALRLKSQYTGVVVCLTDGKNHKQSWSFYSCTERKSDGSLVVQVVRFASWSFAIPYLRSILNGAWNADVLKAIPEAEEGWDGFGDDTALSSDEDDERLSQKDDDEGSHQENTRRSKPQQNPTGNSQCTWKLPECYTDQIGVFTEGQLRESYRYTEMARTSQLVRELLVNSNY